MPTIELLDIERRLERAGVERLQFGTTLGAVPARHQPASGDAAIVWVFGSGGGLGGPAGGVYTRLGERFAAEGVASLEVDYRRPGALRDCVMDALLGAAWLESEGKRRIVLVGHSFGGAVAVTAGALSPAVIAVAALSSQTAGTETVGEISPRPVIFIHGGDDEVLPARCSQDLYARAGEPREMILYPGCRHGLDDCREALDRDLTAWLRRVLALAPSPDPSGTGARSLC